MLTLRPPPPPSTMKQRWFDVGPTLKAVNQHYTNRGSTWSMSRVCRCAASIIFMFILMFIHTS